MNGDIAKYGSLSVILLISIYEITNNPEKFSNFKKLLTNKRWLGHLTLLVLFSISMFYYHPKDSHESISTKRALTAFIIAIFASIDLTIAPFWIIWIFSYSFENWV